MSSGLDPASLRHRAARQPPAKFGEHLRLRGLLWASGDQILVEVSPADPIWGIGLAAEDPRAQDPMHWQGLNLPGFALMTVRDALGD